MGAMGGEGGKGESSSKTGTPTTRFPLSSFHSKSIFSRRDRSGPLMPHCPRCNKSFADEVRVAAHLSQPTSRCNTHNDELITVAEALQRAHQRQPPRHSHPHSFNRHIIVSAYSDDESDDDDDDNGRSVGAGSPSDFNTAMDIDPIPTAHAAHATTHTALNDLHIEKFPHSGTSTESDKSFMSKFHADTFSLERKANIYYPFTSRDEWKLASFLLHSNLSMAAIDSFLKLEMVCFPRFLFVHHSHAITSA